MGKTGETRETGGGGAKEAVEMTYAHFGGGVAGGAIRCFQGTRVWHST